MVADVLVIAVAVYAAIGALLAIAFVTIGVERIDPVAAGALWLFRVLIWPGVAALWPVMLMKWLRATRVHRVESHT